MRALKENLTKKYKF